MFYMPGQKFPVVRQSWTEYERGWGCRPDGYTLHLTQKDCQLFIKDFNAKFNNEPVAPDEYTRADNGNNVIGVDFETYQKIKASKFGIWQ